MSESGVIIKEYTPDSDTDMGLYAFFTIIILGFVLASFWVFSNYLEYREQTKRACIQELKTLECIK